MKSKFYTTIIIAACCILNGLHAQTNTFPSTGAAGIGTTSPNTSSLLEISSTAKGFLMSRMTLAQRNAIASPATGLLIYQTNSTAGFYYYNGSAWKAVTTKAGWSLTGNAGTDSSINFIGTTDAHSLVFRINNIRAGILDYHTYNTSFGYKAFMSNTTGNFNTANGYASLSSNTTGVSNTAVGYYSLFSNTTGYANTALGLALGNNSTGIENTGLGSGALSLNNANDNTSTGAYSLHVNTSGVFNVANGAYSLFSNETGYDNTSTGGQSLYSNTTGFENTATGLNALYNNVTGSHNTGIGELTDVNNDGYNNSTALGVGATITASNQIRIGSLLSPYNPTSIGGVVGWSTLSDGRVKKNIKQNVPGLAFINKLQPITYNLDLNAADKIVQRPIIKDKDGKSIKTLPDDVSADKLKEAVVYTGFIAQDVEKAARSLNYDFSGVDAAKNDKDLYGLRYSDFVVPLVKAVQELSAKNDDLQKQINDLKAMIVSGQATVSSQQLKTISSASLQQNIPNPFNNSTTVAYNLPQTFTSAQIVITDKNGKTIKATNLSVSGKSSLTVDASTLASGAYQYSLIIDGKLIDTKQMVLTK